MAKTRAKKQEDLNFLDIDLNSQKSLVFIALENDSKNKESLNAKKNFDLRFGLNQQKVGVKMIKLTLAQKAFPNLPKLTGQLYLAYSKQTESVDEVTVPKAVINVLQDDQYKNTLNVLGAIVNTEFYDDKKTVLLANTPSLNISLAMIAGTINTIIAKNAILIKEIPTSIARSVVEVSKQI